MVFPFDVHSRVKKGNVASSGDRAKFALAMLFVAGIGFLLFTASFWASLGIPLLLVGFVLFLLFIFIAVTCFRFLVFREQDREKDEGSDVFTQFYGFRPTTETLEVAEQDVTSLELQNSSFVFCMEFRFGVNDEIKSEGTREFWCNLFNIIGEAKMTVRPMVLTDVFSNSAAADAYLASCNKATGDLLRQTVNEIATLTLDYTAKYSKVEVVNIMVYAANKFQMYDFEDVIRRILACYKSSTHAFRSLEFLEQNALLKVYEQFYGVEVIDLTLSKLQMKLTDESFSGMVQVYRVGSTTGRTKVRPIFDDIRTNARKIN